MFIYHFLLGWGGIHYCHLRNISRPLYTRAGGMRLGAFQYADKRRLVMVTCAQYQEKQRPLVSFEFSLFFVK